MIARALLAFALAFVAFFPRTSLAQEPSAGDVLSFLITHQSVATGDFVKDQMAAAATRDTLVRALLVELARVPLTTSSGGFNYRLNPTLGTFERVSEGFGPFFVDRAATSGRGQASFSAAFRFSSFETLDRRNLRDGSFVTSSNKFRDEAQPFDVDRLSLDIQTNTFTLFGTYGLTDDIDIGVAVPVVHLRLSGDRTNIYRGRSVVQASGRAEYVGVADIPVRFKLLFDRLSAWDFATNLELRLPTGDEDNLNGSGRVAMTASMIASMSAGPFESHANGGLTIGGVSNQINGAGAVAVTVLNRFTVSGEALVRHITNLRGIEDVVEPHPSFRGVDTIRLLPEGSPATTVSLVGGVRWNVARTWLVNSYVVFHTTGGGLISRTVPALSIDYSFTP